MGALAAGGRARVWAPGPRAQIVNRCWAAGPGPAAATPLTWNVYMPLLSPVYVLGDWQRANRGLPDLTRAHWNPVAPAALNAKVARWPAGSILASVIRAPDGFGMGLNVAVTCTGAFIVTVHAAVPAQPPPDQPPNRDPLAGVALRVTRWPAS